MIKSRERRLSSWSNATCAMPLCEALSSRRGRGPHHAQKDRVGTWDISRLAVRRCARRRSASGRRGAVADDARTREVGLRHSSCEADEQSGHPLRSNPRGATARSRWSQGRRPRGMRTSKARAGHRAGQACHRRWNAYGKSQGKGRRRGSPRSSTTSASICSRRRSSNSRRTPRRAWIGLTWTDYEADLERNLEDLHDRVQRGAYRALPSRRVYIPKPDGRQRPLGIAMWAA